MSATSRHRLPARPVSWRGVRLLGVAAGAVALAITFSAASGAVDRAPGAVPGIVDIDTNLGYQNAAAAGTGMVLTSSGEVLTNNHVIRGATTIHATDIDNGRTYSASVVGYDINADIAVLQLKNASGLKTIPLGNSQTVKVGDPVTAIGNAGGVGGTPSTAAGTVTALDQSLTASDEMSGTSERLTGLIETNAPLEPGDSGGPLVTSANEVIGMDTAGSTSFFFQPQASAGFAIPINTATALANQIESGHPSQAIHVGPTPFLGVDVEPFNYFQGQQLAAGILIVGVVPASPVEKAGLQAGDVITTLDTQKITSPTTLTNLLLSKAPGATVTLGWVDQTGTSHTSRVRLANGPPQ